MGLHRFPQVGLEEAFWFQEGPGVRNWQFVDEGVKLLNVANIEKSGLINLNKTSRYLSVKEANSKYKHFLCDDGDLVIASSGISFDIDGFLKTRGAFIGRSHLPLCMNTSTIRFKKKSNSDLSYLRHWLQSIDFRKQITKLVTGSAQQNFGPSHLRKIQIPLPPLAEQQRIAAILDKAELVKRKRELAIEKLDSLAQSIYRRNFGISSSIKLEEICSFQNGGTPSKEVSEYWTGDIAWISSADIVGSKIQYGRNFITTLGVDNSATNIAPKGTILIVTRTGVGKVAVTDRPTAFSQDIVSITLKKGFNLNFVCEALKNNLPYFLSHARGATIQGITRSVLASALIPKVDEGSQNAFGKIISAINERNYLFIKSLGDIESLGSSVQSQAFSGQL